MRGLLAGIAVLCCVGLMGCGAGGQPSPRAGDGPADKARPADKPIVSVPAPDDRRFGLTEAERKQLYADAEKAANDAADKADTTFGVKTGPARRITIPAMASTAAKHEKEQLRLLKDARVDLVKRYRVTEEQLGQILAEGAEKKWPAPRRE